MVSASVIRWLAMCCALVFAMVLLGGAVRLTGSGLSMVEWQPIMGAIPPLEHAGWQRAFEKYQQFPEFRLVNPGMTLSGFQFIFWMEYAHRLLGRIIGIMFALPFLFFLWQGKLPRAIAIKLAWLFALGGAQGLLGWYMVKSGLGDAAHVSSYRLAAHLFIAVLIYAYLIRLLAQLCSRNQPPRARKFGRVVVAVILLMIISGGFMAGSHAGFIYNTFPTMGGYWLPPQVGTMTPMWKNWFENPVTIQFTHRTLALLVLLITTSYAASLLREKNRIGLALLVAVFAQAVLGIATLLAGVPLVLGIAHQAGALILLGLAVVSLR